jgi:hypothetical protein
MTLNIELPEAQTAALLAKAQAKGVSAEQYARQVLEENLAVRKESRHISEVIAGIVADVPQEEFAKLPKDGASEHDHYLYGHPKRN